MTDLVLGDDWGLEFVEETPIEEKKGLEEALLSLYTMISPLIENLSRSPENANIRWPNRKPILDKLRKDMQDVLLESGVDLPDL